MKYINKTLLVLIVLMTYLSTPYAATTKFNYQGKVIFNGSPANGFYGMNFGLYDALNNGTLLGGISQNYSIDNGLLNAELDFGDVPFDGQDVFLEIRIQDPSTMSTTILSPRIPVNTAPYAIQANFVADNSITTNSIINGSILGLDLADLTIAGNKIANFQISNNKIINASIGFEKFASNGATDGNIIQYNGTTNQWEAVSQSGITTPWVNAGTGIIYQGSVGIGAGNSFVPSGYLDIRSILNNTIFKINFDGTINRASQTKFLTIGYQSFTPEKSSFQYEINSSGATTGLSNVDPINSVISLYAPIQLPTGATITKFELLAFDNDAANQVTARMKSTGFSVNNVSSTFSTINTGVTPGGVIVSSGTLNENYLSNGVYYVFITLPKPGIISTELIFSGVKITYEVDSL